MADSIRVLRCWSVDVIDCSPSRTCIWLLVAAAKDSGMSELEQLGRQIHEAPVDGLDLTLHAQFAELLA